MTLSMFHLLPPKARWHLVLTRGTFLANRWEQESSVNLYRCAGNGRGFFAEMGIDDGRGQAVVLRSFSDSEARADYALGVRRPT